jgi:hypothetical protein
MTVSGRKNAQIGSSETQLKHSLSDADLTLAGNARDTMDSRPLVSPDAHAKRGKPRGLSRFYMVACSLVRRLKRSDSSATGSARFAPIFKVARII